MPGYRGHFFGAVLFFCISIALLLVLECSISWKMCGQALLFTLLGALFPDIDTKSQGQKLFYTLIFLLIIGSIFYKKYLFGLLVAVCSFVPLFSNHRARFHSLWFALMLVALVSVLAITQFSLNATLVLRNGIFFLIGVYSHLVLDFGFKKSIRKR